MEHLESTQRPGCPTIESAVCTDADESVSHPALPTRESIHPSSHKGVSDLVFGAPQATNNSSAPTLERLASFAGGSYGLTTTPEDIEHAQHGDVGAMLGILGLVPGGAFAKIAATIAKGGRAALQAYKTLSAIGRTKNTGHAIAWTHGETPQTLVKAAEKQGGQATQLVDEWGWRLEEEVTTREVSTSGEIKKIPIVTSTLFDETGNRVVSGVFEGPLWKNHPINAMSGIDGPQRARTAVLLDRVPGERRLALEAHPKRPQPTSLSPQRSGDQPSPYSFNALPASTGPAVAQALHPKLAYDLTRSLQADLENGGSSAASVLRGMLLRFNQPMATLRGVTSSSSVRVTRNSVRPEGLDVWLTNQQVTMVFEILPRDVEEFVTTAQRFVREFLGG